MARERERPRYDDCGDFGNRVTRDPGSGRACLSIPEGLQMWRSRKAGVYRVEFVPYVTTKALEKFTPTLRFCEVGKRWPERSYYVHAGVGVNNESHACLAKNLGQPCPICRYIEVLRRSRQKEDIKLADELKPKLRQLWLVLDHAEPTKGLQLWDEANWNFGRHLLRKVNGADPDQIDRYRAFWHPTKGSTVKLIASEVSMGDGGRNNIEFNVDEFKPRTEDLDDAIFDHGFDLDRIINFLSYEQLEEIFNMKEGPPSGGEPAGRDDGPRRETSSGGFALPGKRREEPKEEDAPPARGRRAEPEDDPPPRSRRSEPEPEEPPARKRREPEPEQEPVVKGKAKWKEGDKVIFKYKDQEFEGTIDSINQAKELAHVKVDGEERLKAVDLEDLKPVAPAKSKAKAAEPDDEPPPRRRQPEPEDDPPPRTRRTAEADDEPPPRSRAEADDAPPPRKRREEPEDDPPPRRRAAEPEAEEKPKGGKKSTWDDEDDDRPFPKRKATDEEEPEKPARSRR